MEKTFEGLDGETINRRRRAWEQAHDLLQDDKRPSRASFEGDKIIVTVVYQELEREVTSE